VSLQPSDIAPDWYDGVNTALESLRRRWLGDVVREAYACDDREQGVNLGVWLSQPHIGCDFRPPSYLSAEEPMLPDYLQGTYIHFDRAVRTRPLTRISKGPEFPKAVGSAIVSPTNGCHLHCQ